MTMVTGAGGMAVGAPDACKTPTPAGPVPIPYPNIAQFTMVNPGTCSTKIMVSNMPACVMNSEIPLSNGDNAGVAGGVVSGVFMGPCKVMMGSTKVSAQNKGVAVVGGMTGHNGSSPNIVGAIVLPSVFNISAMP